MTHTQTNRGGYQGPKWHMGKVFASIDGYAKPIPSFNLQGETTVQTVWGGFWTFVVLTFSFLYAGVKASHLAEKRNPTIIETVIHNSIDHNTMIPYRDLGFNAAFTLVNYFTKENRDDPRYVKWIVRHRGKINGVDFERLLPVHKCTFDDLASFNPVVENSIPLWDKVTKITPTTGMYCLDDDEWNSDELLVGGNDNRLNW